MSDLFKKTQNQSLKNHYIIAKQSIRKISSQWVVDGIYTRFQANPYQQEYIQKKKQIKEVKIQEHLMRVNDKYNDCTLQLH